MTTTQQHNNTTGAISQYFLWKSRGNATSAIPYKCVWGAYIVSISTLIGTGGSHRAMAAVLFGYVINSGFLVCDCQDVIGWIGWIRIDSLCLGVMFRAMTSTLYSCCHIPYLVVH